MYRSRRTIAAKTESQIETGRLYQALLNRHFDEVKQIINKGTNIHTNYISRNKTLEDLCIGCGDASIARFVLEKTGAKGKIASHNTPAGNALLDCAISHNSPEMISLCLECGASLGVRQFERAMHAHSPVKTFLSNFAAKVVNTTDWEQASLPSDELAHYFLTLKLFAPQWIKNAHKYTKQTMDLMIPLVPSELVKGPILDCLLSYLIRNEDVDRLHDNVQKWGLQLSQLQKTPGVHATSYRMMSYLKEQGCLNAKLPLNQNPLHQLFNNESHVNEKTWLYMIQLGVDPFAQDDQGNTPLHLAAAKTFLCTNFVRSVTDNYTDVRFYIILNFLQKSPSTLYEPHNSGVDVFLSLYRFYEKVMNSPDSRQESWINTFKEHMIKFCRKFFSFTTLNTMEALVAYAATFDFKIMKPVLMEKKSLLLNQNIGRGYTLLMSCVKREPLSVCKELVQLGASPFTVTEENTTVFKSIHNSDKLQYFLSLGMVPTFEDIKRMEPEMQVELFDHPNTYQTIVQAVTNDQSLFSPLLSEIVIRNSPFKQFAICKFEQWLKQISNSHKETLFLSNCQHGNAQITQSFVNIVPIDILSQSNITGVADEKILTILLHEGITFDTSDLRKQAIIPLLRFKPHFILRFVNELEEDMLSHFLSLFKQGNYSHLPYNFMEKKILFRRDVIIVMHDFDKSQKEGTMQTGRKSNDDRTNKFYHSKQGGEIERMRFESERAPPMSILVAHLHAIVQDMRVARAKRDLGQYPFEFFKHTPKHFYDSDYDSFDD